MNNNKLSLQTYKCLQIQVGEKAAHEIYNLINNMSEEISNLKRNKVDVTKIMPVSSDPKGSPNVIQSADSPVSP
jgi:hypothetical protein